MHTCTHILSLCARGYGCAAPPFFWHGAKFPGERKRVLFCSLISFATAIGHSSRPSRSISAVLLLPADGSALVLICYFVWRDHSKNDMTDLLRDPAHKMSDGKIFTRKADEAGEEKRNTWSENIWSLHSGFKDMKKWIFWNLETTCTIHKNQFRLFLGAMTIAELGRIYILVTKNPT